MDRDAMIGYCLAKPGAWRDQPWDDSTVTKVGPKIFAFLSRADSIGVKCGRDRDDADEWLERFPADAAPMPYLARSGWNSLRLDGAIPDEDLLAAVDESYDRVVAGLPKKHRP